MSFLENIKEKRFNLKATKSIITHPDGKKFVEDIKNNIKTKIEDGTSLGFVVDTKPDKIPAEIIKNHLYLGSQDCVDVENILKYKITHILSIGIPTPPLDTSVPITTKFIQCLDLPDQDMQQIIKDSVNFISNAINKNCTVLVHCNAGVSRSATIIIAYLMIEKKIPLVDAIEFVKSKRECIQPNSGFVQQLKFLENLQNDLTDKIATVC